MACTYCSCLAVVGAEETDDSIVLTAAEQEWLRAHPSIRIGVDLPGQHYDGCGGKTLHAAQCFQHLQTVDFGHVYVQNDQVGVVAVVLGATEG